MRHRATTVLASVALATAMAATLSGCGQAPWLDASMTTPTATPSAATPQPTIDAVVNELAAGATERTLTAGDVTLTVKYWSTLMMDKWTADANKPLTFSVTGALGTDDGQDLALSKVTVYPSVSGPTGVLPAPAVFTDSASVSPGYTINSPYEYSQTFVLPAVDPAATSITLSFTFELLVQTTPTATTFAKATASDQVTIAITK